MRLFNHHKHIPQTDIGNNRYTNCVECKRLIQFKDGKWVDWDPGEGMSDAGSVLFIAFIMVLLIIAVVWSLFP